MLLTAAAALAGAYTLDGITKQKARMAEKELVTHPIPPARPLPEPRVYGNLRPPGNPQKRAKHQAITAHTAKVWP